MLASMPSFTLPNPALVRTVRLRRPAAQLSRYAADKQWRGEIECIALRS